MFEWHEDVSSCDKGDFSNCPLDFRPPASSSLPTWISVRKLGTPNMTKRPVSHDITWTWTSKWKEQEENLWESQGYLHYYAQLSVKIYILCIIFWRHENVLPCLRAILMAITNELTMCCTSSITDTTSGHQPYITKSTDWTVRKQHSPWFSQVFR